MGDEANGNYCVENELYALVFKKCAQARKRLIREKGIRIRRDIQLSEKAPLVRQRRNGGIRWYNLKLGRFRQICCIDDCSETAVRHMQNKAQVQEMVYAQV